MKLGRRSRVVPRGSSGLGVLSHLRLDDFRRRLPRNAVHLLLRQRLLPLLEAALERRGDAGADGGGDLLEQSSFVGGRRIGGGNSLPLFRCRLSVFFAVSGLCLLLLPRFFLLLLGLRGGESSGGGVLPPLEAAALRLLLGSRGLLKKIEIFRFLRVRKETFSPPSLALSLSLFMQKPF